MAIVRKGYWYSPLRLSGLSRFCWCRLSRFAVDDRRSYEPGDRRRLVVETAAATAPECVELILGHITEALTACNRRGDRGQRGDRAVAERQVSTRSVRWAAALNESEPGDFRESAARLLGDVGARRGNRAWVTCMERTGVS